MLGHHPVEVDRESHYWRWRLHAVLPALPASSIISRRIDDTAHSDESRQLVPGLSQPSAGRGDTDDTDENNQ
ncbi:MAG: hypothetical protein WD628_02580, partial [Thermomicrobiales bacterium]